MSKILVEDKLLDELFRLPLAIPAYQRNYCWEERHIQTLLDDMRYANREKPYLMGTIILNSSSDKSGYDIVDGQQRLVSLAILLRQLNIALQKNTVCSLLQQDFSALPSHRRSARSALSAI